MFRNYLKATFRNLWNNKAYSFINIFGLAIGIACAGFIFLWVEDEVQFNAVFPKKDRLYKVVINETYEGAVRTITGEATPGPLAAAIRAEVPGVANACRTNSRRFLFAAGDKAMYESGLFADAPLFNMFSLRFVEGNAKDAFRQVNAVVITEKMARRFFGTNRNVRGRILKMDNDKSMLVSGVVKDLPANSSLQFSWVAPFEINIRDYGWTNDWDAYGADIFVELQPNAGEAAVNRQLQDIIQKRRPAAGARPFLYSMRHWRLYDRFQNGAVSGGRIMYVRLFSLIAWIILLIACINFMNLATARSEKRAREVGVRKVMGAGRRLLILQFIGEALCMSALAVILGLLLVMLALPAFNALVDKQLQPGLNNPLHLLLLLGITLVCGLVAGSYPALYLSSFKPVLVLKGLYPRQGGAVFIRKGLVVFQFSISIVLIISTIIVYQQIQHGKRRALGFNREHLVQTAMQGDMLKNYAAIKHELLQTGVVENVALASHPVIYDGDNTSQLSWKGKDPTQRVVVSFRMVSPEFISTWGMKLTAGRDFAAGMKDDSTNVIITESLAKLLGQETPVGAVIQVWNYRLVVQGVIKDYQYGNMYGSSDPVILMCLPSQARRMFIRTRPDAAPDVAMSRIGEVIARNNPAYPFSAGFVDDQFNAMFNSEMQVGRFSAVFAMLAVVICCLGLFGLAAYMAERRTREIAIRKVLGAGVAGITGLLSKDFLKLVLVAAFIAFPLAWWLMHGWLQNYSYRIAISPWVFVMAGLVALLIAFGTVSYQAVRAAIANPVRSLKAE